MFSLTVQGTHTNSFLFKSNSGQEFRSFVEGLVLNHVILICSKYRIDLIYNGETNYQEEIMKAWCKVVGKDYSLMTRQKFIRAKGKQETLENYFVSLIYLARIPNWFQEYNEQVKLTFRQEPKHPILQEIINCANYLSANRNIQNLSLGTADKHSIAHYLLKNLHEFASNASRDYLKN